MAHTKPSHLLWWRGQFWQGQGAGDTSLIYAADKGNTEEGVELAGWGEGVDYNDAS